MNEKKSLVICFIIIVVGIILIQIGNNATNMLKQDLENMEHLRICYVQCAHEMPVIEISPNGTEYNGTYYMQCLRECNKAFPLKIIIQEKYE